MNEFEILNLIDITRIIPLIAVFVYAGYADYKTGEVTNKAWLYALIGAPITLAEYAILAPNILSTAIISAAVSIVIAYILFKVKHGWGGADAKALMTLALCYPLGPAYLAWMPLYPMLVFSAASIIAVIAMAIKRTNKIRFLPYVCIGLIAVAII